MIALSTGTLYNYGTARVFELAALAGYDGVEVSIDYRWDTRQPAHLRRLADGHGLPIVALHSPFLPDVDGWPHDQLGRLKRTVELACEIGVPLVVTHLPLRFYGITGHWHGRRFRPFKLRVPIPRREAYFHFLCDELAGFEGETGVTVAVENMPLSRLLGLPVDAYWCSSPGELQRFPHVTIDTTHLGTWGLDPLAVYGQLRGQLAHVHLSNYDGREHRLPQDGRLLLAGFLRALAGDGYAGAVSVECGPHVMEAESEEGCLAALRRTLLFCRENWR